MSDLDENGDQELDFQEFVVLVAALTVACNQFFEEFCKKEGKKAWKLSIKWPFLNTLDINNVMDV